MQVLITATRKTEYATIVEMTEDEFRRYSDKLEVRNREAMKELNRKIDTRDWQDDSLIAVEIKELKD